MATVKKRHIKAVIQLRRATEQEWIDVDPILLLGEPALSTDKNMLKYGDGKHHWSELEYSGGVGGEYFAGNGLVLSDNTFLLDDLILDCGTSTTVI